MHTIEIISEEEIGKNESEFPPPLVFLHGYAAGSALFFQNFVGIAKAYTSRGGKVFALDWRGCGLSPREGGWPKACSISVTAAEDFFLEPLKKFIDVRGFSKVVLVGHSLGGYLSTSFWLRHPERVAGLFLLSPAGWGEPDKAAAGGGAATSSGSTTADPGKQGPLKNFKPPVVLSLFLGLLFNGGCTPGIIVRGMGPCSSCCVRGTLRRRASRWILEQRWSEGDLLDLAGYFFTITALPGTGEHALRYLLTPRAFARLPLLPRVRERVGSGGGVVGSIKDTPIMWLYGGTYDWMSISAGKEAADVLKAAGFSNVSVLAVPNSGHHLYLENVSFTNAAILKGLESVRS